LRLALGLEADLRLVVVLEADLPVAGVFESDFRFAAGFGEEVSASCDASGVVSNPTVGVAAISGSTSAWEVAPLEGSSLAWFFRVDLAGEKRFAGVFEDDLRFVAGFGAVSTSGGASGVASGAAVTVAAVSDSTFGAEVVLFSDSS
jgi:hypothetical protein